MRPQFSIALAPKGYENASEAVPTNAELLQLIKRQDDVIEELTKQLEEATQSKNVSDDNSDGNDVSEALSVNQKLLIEMRDKLKESVNIMEQLQVRVSTKNQNQETLFLRFWKGNFRRRSLSKPT